MTVIICAIDSLRYLHSKIVGSDLNGSYCSGKSEKLIKWWIFINHKGRRRSKKIGSKKAADSVAREVERRLANGDLGIPKDQAPSLLKYGCEMLKSPLNGWAGSTYTEYQAAFDLHIKPRYGSMRLDIIKRKHVKKMITELRNKGLSPSRTEIIVQVLGNILNHAMTDEYIQVNPCDKMGKYCGTKRKKVNPLNAEEAQTLLKNATRLPLVLEALYATMIFTGLRIGETLGVEWMDIDFDARVLNVTKQWDYKRKKIRSPKNNSKRMARLSQGTLEILKRLYEEKGGGGLVFRNKKGTYFTWNVVERWLSEVAPKAITPHDLRHTCATLRLSKGDNLVEVSTQLGHKRVDITLKVYTHWIPLEEYHHQVDHLDEMIFSAPLRTHRRTVNDFYSNFANLHL